MGLNVTGNVQPGADTTTLVPAVKHKLYDGGDNGWAFVVGDNLFVPVRNRRYDAGNYSYAAVSKTVGKTRLTAGGYHYTSDVVAPDAQRAGGQFGFEQTVNPRLTLAADWVTGRHANGYFTPGAIFKPHPKVTGLRRLFNRQRRRVTRQPLLPAGTRLQLQLRECDVTDIVFITVTILFFLLALLYVRACERASGEAS